MEFDSDSAGSIESFFNKLQSSEASPRNLSQIFEDDLLPMRKESRNLRYQPGGHKPQKPQPTTSREMSSESRSSAVERKSSRWEVIFAKVVNVYNGYEAMERLGLALTMLGDNEAATMILYKQKSKLMSNTKLHPDGSTIHLRDHYLQFYDNNRKYWNLRFVHQADEQEFIHFMTTNGWPLEQRTSNSETDGERQHTLRSETDAEQEQKRHTEPPLSDQIRVQLSDQSREQWSEQWSEQRSRELRSKEQHTSDIHTYRRDNEEHQELPPQPKPRSRNLATPSEEQMQKSAAYMKCLRHHFMHEACEHMPPVRDEIAEEDVIVTPISRPIGSTSSSNLLDNHFSSANAVVKLQESETKSTTSLLTKFVNTHMDPEDIAAMKMQNILDAMQRVSDGHRKKFNDKGTPKPEPRTTAKTEDAEDRLLELEQILLDAKKENRELMKELKRRDEELHDFKTSSLTLLEKLLSSNDELAKKNSLLVDTIVGDRKATNEVNCVSCERSAEEIAFLKRHITALELALRESE
ncbi:hypothetical protein KR032_004677 [Drosophila birchii]|nr:hypothetical protein KR032_004677 [Drosophila birchii]